jgi:hypothetical protein
MGKNHVLPWLKNPEEIGHIVLHGRSGTEQGTSHVLPWLKSPEEITTQCATWNQWYRMGRNHVLPCLQSPEEIEHNVLHGTKGTEQERTVCCLG